MKKSRILWFLPILGLLTMPVVARDYDHGTDRLENRLERQERRVERGVRRGTLTDKEARQLRKTLEKTANKQRKYLRDGALSREERRALAKRLDKSSELIRQLARNDRYRGYPNRKGRGYDNYRHDRHDRFGEHDSWRYGPDLYRYDYRYGYPDTRRYHDGLSGLLAELDAYRYGQGDRYGGKETDISDWLYLLDRLSR